MTDSIHQFIARSNEALANTQLQQALAKARPGFVKKRQLAVDAVDNFEALRDKAREVRQRSLRDLDIYLAMFESNVRAAGGEVHWAKSTADMQAIVVDIARGASAKTATKGKSMVGEEAEINAALSRAGVTPVETDLGEYILQLAEEPPSHIVAPALHKTRQQIADLFSAAHTLNPRELDTVQAIVDEARQVIRRHFIDADIGITGANILIAETGTAVLCTNEGNGDLTASLPQTHIITTSIDKVVPTWNDASAILRVLARSATGQSITTYTTFYGPRQTYDLDGPDNFHVVLLDNGRAKLLGSDFQEMLHCIKCGACMNHCPVYQAVGGHSYDSVYPGPMGSVLTPLLRGEPDDFGLSQASTFCGRCEAVCPVKIPLPDLLRKLRNVATSRQGKGLSGWLSTLFMTLARYPRLYRLTTGLGLQLVSRFHKKATLRSLPGLGAWQNYRKLPAPQNRSFQSQWNRNKKNRND
jgi:L-lactate dehydrogenase complex protein LldF